MAAKKGPDGSTREEVLRRTKGGDTPRQIALVLGLSVQGVNYHIQKLRAAGSLSQNGRAS